MRIGGLPPPPRPWPTVARGGGEAVGPDIKLMADGNGAYNPVRRRSRVGPGGWEDRLGLYWFEEPLPESPNYAGLRSADGQPGHCHRRRRGGSISRGGGQGADLAGRAFDISSKPDISLLRRHRRVACFVAEMARPVGDAVQPPTGWACAIVIAATLHLLALLAGTSRGARTNRGPPMLELEQL